MAETKIEWADYTFNPWIGCQKVAAGCTNCYAESFVKRYGKATWGPNGTRVKTSEANWKKPLKWNREAEAAGERRRVFCASLADVFEDWTGPILSSRTIVDEPCPEDGFQKNEWNPVLWHRSDIGICEAGQTTVDKVCNERLATMDDIRRELFTLIDATPHLDWLLLTKRPENIRRMWQWSRHSYVANDDQRHDYRPNVWLGASVATQADADRNIPLLLECRDLAPVLFLSCEPLVEAVKLPRDCFYEIGYESGGVQGWVQTHEHGIDWIIAGGESNHGARPCHPDWVRSIRDQCKAADVPFLFKQWGEHITLQQRASCSLTTLGILSKPVAHCDAFSRPGVSGQRAYRVGKKAAGRLLDGKEYSQFPEVTHGR